MIDSAENPRGHDPAERRKVALWAAGVVLATVALYAPSLGNGFMTVWDDPQYVTENPDIRGFTAANLEAAFTRAYVGNYAPLHILSYTLDYTFFGLDPFGFRFVNLVLHAINAVLVLLLVRRVSKNLTLAGLSALVFALHPVQVESVAWVAERKNLLSTTFMLVSFFLYLRFLDRGRWPAYAGALVLFALALLTKVSVVVLPALLVLYVFLFDERRIGRFATTVPFFLLAAAGVAGAVITQERALIAWGGPVERALTVTTILVRYLGLFLFPVNLSPSYDLPTHDDLTWPVIGSTLLLGALAWVVWWRRRDRTILFWTGWACITLLPVLHIVPLATLMNDRYLYLPLIGLAPLPVMLLGRVFGRGGIAVVALLLIALIPVTYHRTTLWTAGPGLWLDAIERHPKDVQLHINLAAVYVRQGERDKARDAYLAAIAVVPHKPGLRQELAGYLMKIGSHEAARVELEKLYDLGYRNENLVSNLGFASLDTGRLEQGLRYHEEVLARNPRYVNSIYGLALAYEKLGRLEKSEAEWRRFLALTPPGNPWRANAERHLERVRRERGKGR